MLTAVEKVKAGMGSGAPQRRSLVWKGVGGVAKSQLLAEMTAEKHALRGKPSSFTAQGEETIV